MKKICGEAIRLLESDESFVQATVLASSGSTPRGAGSCMLVLKDGSISGTIGGGALEAGVIEASEEVLKEKRARIATIILDGNDAAALGVICGGTATVLVDYIDAGHPGNLEFFKALRTVIETGAPSRIVTSFHADGVSRCQCLLPPDGPPLGADGFNPNVLKALQNREGSYDAFTRLDSHDVFFLRAGADGMAYIFGAGHCGEKLAHILPTVGFGTVVIDDREEFANRARFPEADEILVPETMDLPFGGIAFDDSSYIIIVTRGHAHDELVLRGALRTGAGYIGMIGSKRKRETIYANLLADGYKQSDIDRVYSPIGMDIGAETPEEIAVSITAEMIKVRAERK